MAALTTALTLGVLGLLTKSQMDQQKAAKKAAQEAKDQQFALENQAAAEKAKADENAANIARRAAMRSAASASGVPQRSTVLTSPLGITSAPTSGGKTLLGM
jgi:hypothetical protein